MFQVTRSATGSIATLSRDLRVGGEVLDDNNPEVRAFLGSTADDPVFFEMDADFVRVIEDLIDTLIRSNIIRLTDLPVAAQKKLLMRKGARHRLGGALDLLARDDRIL